MTTHTANSKLGNVIRVSSGNFLEMYDFMVYAYYASYIAHEIFPSSNAYASLMMTLGTFGAGYLMRPLGAVVLLQLTWGSELTKDERELLVERLGLHPHLLVEWKQMLREAGVVDIQVQDWTSGAPGCRTRSGMAREMAEATHLTWPQKVQIATRSWSTGRGARRAIEREVALLRDLSDERAIGFQVIKGVKWPRDAPRA